ncbi:MAG TPA: Gfo/Idh/MocA family oxidoreductase [Planctomycetota bacterium]|nr:Gfo/Idh/MocA family oxidoreductase [Planctomycetota bacterium]
MAKQEKEKTGEKKKLRVALIGAGGISNAHTENYKKFDDVEVVGACDVSEASLKKFSDRHGITALYGDWKTMIKEARPDAVSVCTPNGLHLQPTLDALNAGCHVLVEKPLALNAAEGQKMIDVAKKNKRHLVIGFQHRFDGRTKLLKRAVDEGVFGKILFVRVQALRRRGIPNWGVFGRKELQGGGPLIDIGVHVLEMAHYTIGSPEPVSATGSIFTYLGNKPSDVASQWPGWDYKTYNVEDLAIGHIKMKTGTVIHVEAAFATHIEKDVWTFQIFGEKGGATYDPTTIFHDHAGMMLNATPAYVPKIEVFPHKMRHFVDVCLYDRQCEAPAEHGLMVQKMLDGIYQSAEAGREVKID